MPAIRIIVTGRVQGVGFRYFVQRSAEALGVKGWVRNLHTGNQVETYAEGDRATLERLIDQLRKGPAFGRVDDLHAVWLDDEKGCDSFQITY
ncbi:acylphosphatase [Candidatus Sumerlaeota bacterium]|nr:acylphosphatase [Candidatus Sumerlaeota bacterium]